MAKIPDPLQKAFSRSLKSAALGPSTVRRDVLRVVLDLWETALLMWGHHHTIRPNRGASSTARPAHATLSTQV